jgi:hypothetical protein
MNPELLNVIAIALGAVLKWAYDRFAPKATPAPTPGPAPVPSTPILDLIAKLLSQILAHPTLTPEAKAAALHQITDAATPLVAE